MDEMKPQGDGQMPEGEMPTAQPAPVPATEPVPAPAPEGEAPTEPAV